VSRGPFLGYGIAVLLAALAQFVRTQFHPLVLSPLITFVPFILAAAAIGGAGPGLLSTVLCVLAAGSTHLGAAGAVERLRLGDLAVTGAGASILIGWLHRSVERQRAAFLELATIQNSAPVLLLVVDEQLRVRKANPLAMQSAGREVSEACRIDLGDVLGCMDALDDPRMCGHGPACGDCVIRRSVLDAVRNGVPHFGVEGWVAVSRADRPEQRWLMVSTVPLRLQENGRTVLVCAQDITAQKSAEAEIRQQRDTLRQQAQLIDLSHDAIILMDQNRAVTGWNTGAQEMYGWTEAEARGQKTHILLQTTASQANAQIDTILSQAGRWDGELVHTRRDGVRIAVESRQVLQRDTAGEPVGILEINRDITERAKAEADLREAHRRTAVVLESISDGYNVLDRQCRYLYVNAAAARMLHKTAEELLGRNLWEMWPHAADSPFGKAFRRAVEQNIPVQVESYYPEPLNAWFEARCYPTSEGVSLFFNDITERKRVEQEIRDLNADLERRVRERTAQFEAANHDLEAFAYTVSHDLRAPLRGIDGWSLALEQDYGGRLDTEGRRYLERVRSEAARMGRLIEDLLEFSSVARAPLNRDAVDLSAIARRIVAAARESQPERVLEFVIQPDLTVHGDACLLEAALANLLGNAVKFTGKCAQARVEFGGTRTGAASTFFVRDNGAGFDASQAGRLFEAFQRLHNASEFPGTGIGLATVRRVVERHGGRIWAESRPGQGATFFFTLP